MAYPASPLKLNGLDHVIRVAPDLQPAWEALQRLGINATPPGPAGDTGALNTVFSVGGPENPVAIEYLSLAPDKLDDPRNADVAALVRGGGGMHLLGFEIDDLAPARAAFAAGGFEEREISHPAGDGQEPIRSLRPRNAGLGCDVVFLRYPPPVKALRQDLSRYRHQLPLKRVDHVAVVVADLEATSRCWTGVLGASLHHQGVAFGMDVHMVKVGDVVVELLKPGPEGALAGAAPGLRPTVSYEVDDLQAVMADVRARGFKVLEPTRSSVGDRIFTTIAPRQTAGLVFQFLQYL